MRLSLTINGERRNDDVDPRTLLVHYIRDLAGHAAEDVDVLSDLHASAEFRAELARVYTRRALETTVARAQH
jgi:CO/xanthine dehydrogenase FAD-binding subunit